MMSRISQETERPLSRRRKLAANVLAAVGVFAAATWGRTAVGIVFEAGVNRLILAIIAPISGIVAVLSIRAANRLGTP